jgi:hypothetical protein
MQIAWPGDVLVCGVAPPSVARKPTGLPLVGRATALRATWRRRGARIRLSASGCEGRTGVARSDPQRRRSRARRAAADSGRRRDSGRSPWRRCTEKVRSGRVSATAPIRLETRRPALRLRLRASGRCLARTGDLLLVRREQLLRSTAVCRSSRSASDARRQAAALCCGFSLPRRFRARSRISASGDSSWACIPPRLGHIRATQGEGVARGLHRCRWRIAGEETRRVHLTQHDPTHRWWPLKSFRATNRLRPRPW